jgi:hypothetical protein
MFDYHNPHVSAIECCIRQPVGSIIIKAGEVVPTPEMEDKGITADVLAPFIVPNLLRPTPPVVRRRFLQAGGFPVPEDIIAATAHLPEFGGAPQPVAPPAAPTRKLPTPKPRQATRHNFASELETALKTKATTPSLQDAAVKQGQDDQLQRLADGKCSSTKEMRPVDPDAKSW